MNWEAIGAIGELVAAIAVVATLGYLAVQTKFNTRAIEMEARQSVLDRFTQAHMFILPVESTQAAVIKGMRDFDQLSDDEVMAMTQALSAFATNLYNAKRMYDEGVLDIEALEYISGAFVGCCASVGGSKWWLHVKTTGLYPKAFTNYVDEKLQEGGNTNVDAIFSASSAGDTT